MGQPLPPGPFSSPANPQIYSPLQNTGLQVQQPSTPGVSYAATGFHGGNVLDGPPAAVLSAILVAGTGGPALGVFTTTAFTDAFPDLPSVVTDVVFIA